jgi:hypothetical protein
MSAIIVNETTYTVWCGDCPFSTEPTIYREQAERWAAAHDADRHSEAVMISCYRCGAMVPIPEARKSDRGTGERYCPSCAGKQGSPVEA